MDQTLNAADRFAALAERTRQETAAMSMAAAWQNAREQVATLPKPEAVKAECVDSSSVTETWKAGGCPWHHH